MLSQPSRYHHGLEYEQRARVYLERAGYRILAQNVRFRFGEIDLVAEIGETLVFVEVRKRDQGQWLQPEETLTLTKVLRLRRAIQSYLCKYRGRATQARIDLIGFSTITIDKNGKKNTEDGLRHFQNFIQN